VDGPQVEKHIHTLAGTLASAAVAQCAVKSCITEGRQFVHLAQQNNKAQ
jgi:hypothetical protein